MHTQQLLQFFMQTQIALSTYAGIIAQNVLFRQTINYCKCDTYFKMMMKYTFSNYCKSGWLSIRKYFKFNQPGYGTCHAKVF